MPHRRGSAETCEIYWTRCGATYVCGLDELRPFVSEYERLKAASRRSAWVGSHVLGEARGEHRSEDSAVVFDCGSAREHAGERQANRELEMLPGVDLRIVADHSRRGTENGP